MSEKDCDETAVGSNLSLSALTAKFFFYMINHNRLQLKDDFMYADT
jgi:hypothetical protein